MKSSGLIPERRDIRNFNHEVQFGAADISQLPPMGLGRKPLSIKNQKNTQFCTGFGTATASEYIEGVEMSPEFSVAKIGEILGKPITAGATASAALKALRLFGSLPQKDAPYTLEKDGEKVADWRIWPRDLNQRADDFLKASNYDVMRGSHDAFDNIKSALARAREDGEERVAICFTQWFNSWHGRGIMRRGIGGYSWHCWLIIDWTVKDGEEVLIGQNSYGKNWGENGLVYFSREAINQLAEDSRNDIQMVRDLTPETAKEAQWGLAVIIYDMLVKNDPTGAIKWLVEFMASWLVDWKSPQAPKPEPTPPPTVPPAPEPKRLAVYEEAKLWLGKDASPSDIADDEVGCAESVTNILRRVYPDFPILVSTARLNEHLKKDKRFKATLDFKPGNIIVSPTVGKNVGHTGICGENERIMSNTSKTGKWEDNYSLKSWVAYFRTTKALRVYYFEPL